MTLRIVDVHPLSSTSVRVFGILQEICSGDNGGLGFNSVYLDQLTGIFYNQITYKPTAIMSSQSLVGANLIDYLVNHYPGTVTIWGMESADQVKKEAFSSPQPMEEIIGFTKFSGSSADVYFDLGNCDGRGYHVRDLHGNEIDAPLHTILFHELAHVKIGNVAHSEDLAIKQENFYRTGRSLPERDGHQAACGLAKPGKSFGGLSDLCFIVTAASGGPNSPEVNFLRDIRDNLLLRIRNGRHFFETFYSYYYRFSPPIAKEMHENPELKSSFRLALVTPLLNYYRLAVTRPEWDLENIPLPMRNYLESMGKEMDAWLEEFELPTEFESISPKEAAEELSVVLKFILRSHAARYDYLEDLTRKGSLPLSGEKQDLILANQHLIESKVPVDELNKIMGHNLNMENK
jgi:hypothetical protein